MTTNQPCFQLQWLDDMCYMCCYTPHVPLVVLYALLFSTKVFRVVCTDPCRACGQLYRQLARKILQIWVMIDKYPNKFWRYFRKTTWFQDRWRSPLPLVLVYHGPLLSRFWGIASSTFTTVYLEWSNSAYSEWWTQARRFHSPYVRGVLWISNHLP